MDTCKDATSTATPTKLTITKAFCPFDLITAHHAEYHGVSCTAWRNDLDWLLQAYGVNDSCTNFDTLQLDRPERAQLRQHLLKWGFVKEVANNELLECNAVKVATGNWVISVRTTNHTWNICEINKSGLNRVRAISRSETAFALDGDMIHLVR